MHLTQKSEDWGALSPALHPMVYPQLDTHFCAGDLASSLRATLPEAVAMDDPSFLLRRLGRRDHLYRAGDNFRNLYLILSGVLMTTLLDEDGISRPIGFSSSGHIVGIDGIERSAYRSSTTSVTPSAVLILPYKTITDGATEYRNLQEALRQLICRELIRSRRTTLMLRNFSAQARVITFLLDIAVNLTNGELSSRSFLLPVTRQEIADFLGLDGATVSRALTSLRRRHLINIEGSTITIVDAKSLMEIHPTRRN